MGKDKGKEPVVKAVTGAARFAAATSDPRFARAARKEAGFAVDKRFAGMFKDARFQPAQPVDKRGRARARHQAREDLARFYRLQGADAEAAAAGGVARCLRPIVLDFADAMRQVYTYI